MTSYKTKIDFYKDDSELFITELLVYPNMDCVTINDIDGSQVTFQIKDVKRITQTPINEKG